MCRCGNIQQLMSSCNSPIETLNISADDGSYRDTVFGTCTILDHINLSLPTVPYCISTESILWPFQWLVELEPGPCFSAADAHTMNDHDVNCLDTTYDDYTIDCTCPRSLFFLTVSFFFSLSLPLCLSLYIYIYLSRPLSHLPYIHLLFSFAFNLYYIRHTHTFLQIN